MRLSVVLGALFCSLYSVFPGAVMSVVCCMECCVVWSVQRPWLLHVVLLLSSLLAALAGLESTKSVYSNSWWQTVRAAALHGGIGYSAS